MPEKKKTKDETSGNVSSPVTDTGSDQKPSEATDTIETRKHKIEHDVEGLFSKFEGESGPGKQSPQIIADSPDIIIELEDDRKVGLDEDTVDKKIDRGEGKRKPSRRIFVIGGILIVLAIAITFFVFKTDGRRPRPAPSETPTVKKIRRPSLKPPAKKPRDKTVSKSEKAAGRAAEIKAFLIKWKTAWENTAGKKGDMDTFMSFYADNFISKGLNKSEWRKDKIKKNRRKDWIRLELKDIHIAGPVSADQAEVAFLLIYKSSNYSDETNKTLVLKKEATGWKITGIK